MQIKRFPRYLFVDKLLAHLRIVVESFREPEADLVLSALNGVTSMNDVASDVDAVVAADGAGVGVEGLGGTEHLAASENNVVAFPHHGNDGSHHHVLDETGEEGLGGKISIVLLEVFLGRSHHLERNELESFLLKTLDDGADKAAHDAVGLDHDVSLFTSHFLFV